MGTLACSATRAVPGLPSSSCAVVAARAFRGDAQRQALFERFHRGAQRAKIGVLAVQPDDSAGVEDPLEERVFLVFIRHQRGDVGARGVDEEQQGVDAAHVVGGDDHPALRGQVFQPQKGGAGDVRIMPFMIDVGGFRVS